MGTIKKNGTRKLRIVKNYFRDHESFKNCLPDVKGLRRVGIFST